MRREKRASNLDRLLGRRPQVELSVDEFVLHGFRPSERFAIGDAFQAEMERILAGTKPGETFRAHRELSRLAAGPITLTVRMRPESVGAQVARAVYGSLDAGEKGKKS